jgi:hypothetical protein
LARRLGIEDALEGRHDVGHVDDREPHVEQRLFGTLDDVGVGERGAQRMDADAVGLVGLAKRADQADDGVLVGRINGVEGSDHQAGHGRGGHDRPAAAGDDGAPGGRNPVDHAVDVDGHRTPVGLRVEIVAHATPGGGAGVEVGDVEAAERLDGKGDRGRACRRVGHVGPDEPAVDLLGDRFAPRHVDVGDHHTRSPAGQMPGDALTDAVAPPGDEGDLAVDVECHATRS